MTVTKKVQVSVLPLLSVAMQVTMVVPTGKKLPDGGVQTTVSPVQLSVTEAAYTTTAPQLPVSLSCVMSAGQLATGGSVSSTVTSKVQVVVVPAASVAVHVTVVTPTGNTLPEGGKHDADCA